MGTGLSGHRITLPLRSRVANQRGGPLKVNLAISVNATDRGCASHQIMPAANRFSIRQARLPPAATIPWLERDRLSLNYVLLADVNDRPGDARSIDQNCAAFAARSTLIVFNPFPGSPYRRPSDAAIDQFQNILRRGHVDAYQAQSRSRCPGALVLANESRCRVPVTLTQIRDPLLV